MSFKTISVAGLLLMVAAMVALIFRESLFGSSPLPIVVQTLAVLLMLWARATFKWRSFHAAANPTEGGIVRSGPYRYIRHPIYAAVLYFAWAGIFSHPGTVNVLLGMLVIAGAVLRMFPEEKLLLDMYPHYAEYARQTKRIIPYLL